MLDEMMIYLKTTDTCQLNCDHCFTNGSRGAKGFFNPDQTIDFLKRLKTFQPTLKNGSISFHGGEPLLCPTEHMFSVWNECQSLWDNVWWSLQTNLTYKLTQDKVDVLSQICQKSWGTSYDYKIRWTNKKSEDLWRSNLKELTSAGHKITVIVSVTGDLIKNKEPIEIIDDMASLGVNFINFERVTANGNALINLDKGIMPSNKDLDHWFAKMWDQSVQNKTYEYIDNMFFDSILSSMIYQTFSGCRCRQCEQKVLTINANGTIGGCPNSAVDNTFGHINDDIKSILSSEGRMCNIQTESLRNSLCHSCDVYNLCNGDCHQLPWEGSICAAPKTMMQAIKNNNDIELYKKFLNGFMGQE